MSRPLPALPAALDLAVFAECDEGGFAAIDPLPGWAGEYLSGDQPLRLGEDFLFLETFLDDAAETHASRAGDGVIALDGYDLSGYSETHDFGPFGLGFSASQLKFRQLVSIL